MMKLSSYCLLLACYLNLHAQGYHPNLRSWDVIILAQAKFSCFSLFQTKQERDVIYYINLARLNGKLFNKTILVPYLEAKGDTDMKDPYISSLISELNKLPRLRPLRSSQLLTKKARDYATSSGKEGIVGHKNFDQRFSSLYRLGKTVGENCAYHQQNALDVVIDLLIDQDEPSLGHRHNILSPGFARIGVGIAPHRDNENIWVIEFSGQ